MFQYLRTSRQKVYWQYAWVFTQLDVNSLKAKFFRHVAMNRHIKSVRFIIKIRKTRNIRPCFSNSGDNTAVSQLCNFSYKPPFYLPNSSPVEHISMHAYSIGWHLSCYHPPMHAYSVGWHLSCYHLPSQPRLLPYFPLVHVACKFVACVSSITHV